MSEDTSTVSENATAPSSVSEPAAAPADASASAGTDAKANTLEPDADMPEELRRAKLVILLKLVRQAVKLANLGESFGLLQVAAALIDMSCLAADKPHEEGIKVVNETLKKVTDERAFAETTARELVDFIERIRTRSKASAEQ